MNDGPPRRFENRRDRLAAAVLIGALLLASGLLLFSTARRTSLVYDEVIYAPAGLLYWRTGDFRWNPEHPPLEKLVSALPLLASSIPVPPDLDSDRTNAWRAGFRVFFRSGVDPRTLILRARLPSIALSLLLLFVLFQFFRSRWGVAAALIGATTVAADPLFLGNGALAMNDIFVTAFCFFSFVAFEKSYNTSTGYDRRRWLAMSGALAGAAVASKMSGLLIVITLLLIATASSRKRKESGTSLVLNWAWIGIPAFLVFLGTYGFDIHRLGATLLAGSRLQTAEGASGFLLRRISGRSGWFYFPVALLIKTPIPLLILWTIAIVFRRREPFQNGAARWILFPAFLGAACLASKNHYGLRYLMPALPFLAGFVARSYAAANTKERRVMVVLVAWLTGIALTVNPHAMAYFNPLVGGSKNGYRWLDGSNQDWGQDLPALAAFLDHNGGRSSPRTALLLGYWGSNDPAAWGLRYQDVFSPAIVSAFRNDDTEPVEVEHEWLVVSAGLIANPDTAPVYAWLSSRQPVALLGSTLFVYDITHDAPAALQLAELYRIMNRPQLEQRERARAQFINNNPSPASRERAG